MKLNWVILIFYYLISFIWINFRFKNGTDEAPQPSNGQANDYGYNQPQTARKSTEGGAFNFLESNKKDNLETVENNTDQRFKFTDVDLWVDRI